MYLKLFFLSMISFGVSESLYSIPDLWNPLIPLRSRQLCGYRNRPLRQKISHNNKCFMHSFEDKMAINPFIEVYPNQSTPITRVLNGVDAIYGEAPWAVQLGLVKNDSFDFVCSGVLITDRHILTAAHCYESPPDLYVFIGGYTPFSSYFTNKFQFIKYSNYKNVAGWIEHDIAIIVLDKPIVFAYYQFLERHYLTKHFQLNTICLPLLEKSLPEDNETLQQYERATFFGWGRMVNDTHPKWLQKADVKVRYEDMNLHNFITRPNVYPQGCRGDSGSGLVQYLDHQRTRAVLIGIAFAATIGPGPIGPICNRRMETTFVRVANVLDWIYDRLKADINIE